MWSLFNAFFVIFHSLFLCSESIIAKSGVLFKKNTEIPKQKIIALIHYSFFTLNRLYIVTTSTKTKRRLFSVYKRKANCNALINKIMKTENPTLVYKMSFIKTLMLCMTWSDFLTGFILFYPFLRKIEIVFGHAIREEFYRRIDISADISSVGLPKKFAGIAGIILIGWMFAVLVQFIRYANFKIYKADDKIIISRGLGVKNRYITKQDTVSSVTVKQSIMMSLFRLKSVYINTVGITLLKGDKGLIFTASKKDTVYDLKKLGLLSDAKRLVTLMPVCGALSSYLYLPYSFTALSSLLILISDKTAKIFLSFILLTCIIWFLFRIKAYKNTALSFYDKAIRIDYFKGLNLTSTIISRDNLKEIKIRQSFIQRFFNTCNICIYLYSSSVQKQVIKHLNYKLVKKNIKSLYQNEVDESILKSE